MAVVKKAVAPTGAQSGQLPAFASSDLVVFRRNRWVLGLTSLPILAALALAFAGLTIDPTYLSSAPQLALLGVVFTFIAYRNNWWPSVKSVPASAGIAGVTLGSRFIPRARIRAALRLPGIAPRLLLRRRFGFTLELQMGSHEEARALQLAIGLDASQAAADFLSLSRAFARPSAAPVSALTIYLAGVACKVAGNIGRAVAPVYGTIAFLAFLAFVIPTRLRVSADGVALRWLWTERFLDLGEIEDVTRYEKWGVVGLRIQLCSGRVLVPMGLSMGGKAWGESAVALAWERIREAMVAVEQNRAAAGSSPGPNPHVAIEKTGGDDKESPLDDIESVAATARGQRETGRKSE